MIYDVIERDASWWLRIDGAAIGPFESEYAARQWAHGFGGQDERASRQRNVLLRNASDTSAS